MAVYRFKLIPLSPIHVGTGETIAPEDYFILGDKLTRFHPPAAVRAMPESERKRYMALLEGGDTNMPNALSILRERAKQTRSCWIYSIPIGDASRQALQEAVGKLDTRRGEVHPLFWNPATGSALLPGSAIKGAIRTAFLSALVANKAAKDSAWAYQWSDCLPASGARESDPRGASKNVAEMAGRLEEEIIRGNRQLEYDPFRFIKVHDISVPGDLVRVDRAMLLGAADSAQARKIQMHFERILSRYDTASAPEFDLLLTVDREEKRWHQGIRPFTDGVPPKDYIIGALNFHFVTAFRREAENERFRNLYGGPWQRWLNECLQPGCALIRLGRFSHFESLSTEVLRRTLDRRGQWITQGTSRTYCTPDGERKLPFGWAMLRFVNQIQ